MSAKIYFFDNEDHTLGTLLQNELLKNENVLFAGYIQEHPLEHNIQVKIVTKSVNYEPDTALETAFIGIKNELIRRCCMNN